KVEVAGEGFINFFLAPDALARQIRRIHELGDAYGRSTMGARKRVALELAFVDPIRRLNVEQGRQAAYAAALAKLLRLAGHDVHRKRCSRDAERDRILVHIEGAETITLLCGSTTVNASDRNPPVTLRELRKTLGIDVCRFFYLLRGPEQNLVLDPQLAT